MSWQFLCVRKGRAWKPGLSVFPLPRRSAKFLPFYPRYLRNPQFFRRASDT